MNSNFTSNFSHNPFTLTTLAGRDIESVKRDMNIMENKSDWKKFISDRLVRRMMKQRGDRMDSIRLNKEEIINELRYEEILSDHMDDECMILSEYFDKLLVLFENDRLNPGEYLIETHKNSNVSVCPACSYPVILTATKIICLNLCYEYNLPQNLIDEEFTLDNFLDLYSKTRQAHWNCIDIYNEGVQLLVFDDDVHLVCGKCFRENTG